MDLIKFILFIELIGMVVAGLFHFIAFICKENFPIKVYFILSIILLFAVLLINFIFLPIFRLI